MLSQTILLVFCSFFLLANSPADSPTDSPNGQPFLVAIPDNEETTLGPWTDKFTTTVVAEKKCACCAPDEPKEPKKATERKTSSTCPLCVECKCDECKCELSGIWHATFIEGENSDEDKGYGVCLISQVGSKFVFNWASGNHSTIGIGIRKGRFIAVNWIMDSKIHGVSLYEVRGKELHGVWSPLPADQTERTEILRWMRRTDDKEI